MRNASKAVHRSTHSNLLAASVTTDAAPAEHNQTPGLIKRTCESAWRYFALQGAKAPHTIELLVAAEFFITGVVAA
jgi:hypothetical protein